MSEVQHQSDSEREMLSFISGLVLGFIISVPVVAWLSPRKGKEVWQGVSQHGMIIRRRVGQTIRKPVAQVQQQLEQFKGDSVEKALTEGKAIAAQRQSKTNEEGG